MIDGIDEKIGLKEDMTYPNALRHNQQVPFRWAIKNRAVQKHIKPPREQNPEKRIGRHHINDLDSNAPAIGVPSSFKIHPSKQGRKE